MVGVVDALGGRTSYGYDSRGNRTSVTDANGNTTTFSYNDANRLVGETTPIGTATTFAYDLAGNRTGKLDGKLQNTQFVYDSNRRLTQITFASGTPASFTFDVRGNKLTEANGDSQRTMTYDLLGRLASVQDHESGRTISYTYDANGNRTSMKVMPDDETTQYAWDARNLLISMTDPEGGVYHFTYDALGRRTRTLYPNRMTATMKYDAASRIIEMAYRKRTGEVVESFSYTYDARGNRTAKIFGDGTSELYSYDDLSRLVGVTYPSGRAVRYIYDGVGNRLEMFEGQASAAAAVCPDDLDCDGVKDALDVCPTIYNPGQENSDDPDVPQGFAGAWRFEEPVWALKTPDLTGHHEGTRIRGEKVPGKFGSALKFGIDEAVRVPSTPRLRDVSGDAFSIATWMAFPDASMSGAIAGKSGQWTLTAFRSVDSMSLHMTGNGTSAVGPFPLPADNEWVHVVMTYDHGTLRYYINGQMLFTHTGVSFSPSDFDLFIGCGPAGNVCNSGGSLMLDEFAVWPRTLTEAEIGQLQTRALAIGDGKGDVCDPCPTSPLASCVPTTCLDRDGDGFGVAGASACGGNAQRLDCDDGHAGTHPDAVEVCDGIDNNCNGRIDEGCITEPLRTLYNYNAFNQLLASGPAQSFPANDADGDGIADSADNCPLIYNPLQTDSDAHLVNSPGAIAAWGFNEGSGTVVQDATGNHPGTIVGNVTRITNGAFGGALSTDGTIGNYVHVPTLGSLTPPYTIQGRVRRLDDQSRILMNFGQRDPWLTVSNILNTNNANSSTQVPLGEWTHVAMTNPGGGTGLQFWINGEESPLSGQPTTFGMPGATTNLGGEEGNFSMNGDWDELAAFSRVLTPAELARHASRGIFGDGIGDVCDPCANNADPTCVPATCIDADGDGYGPPGASACTAGEPARFDCNDSNPAVHPGVKDICNGIDDDCDGLTDEECPTAETYTYDGNGNQTSHATVAGTTEYVWDARDRLAEVRLPGGAVSRYGYDTQNLRVRMEDAAGERRVLLDGIEEYGEFETTGGGAQVARYDHDPSRVDALVAQVKGQGAMRVNAHAFTDALGSVYGLVDGEGDAVARYGYDVYGARSVGQELVATDWGFTGRRHEGDGTYYRLRFRGDASWSWWSPDPEGFGDGTNLYGFVHQSPPNGVDPWGLKTLVITGYPFFGTDHKIYRTVFGGAKWEQLLEDMLEKAGLIMPRSLGALGHSDIEVRSVFGSGSLEALAAEIGMSIEPIERVIWVGHLAPCGQDGVSTCLDPGQHPNGLFRGQLISPGNFSSFLSKVKAYGGAIVVGCGDVSSGTAESMAQAGRASRTQVCFTNTRVDIGYNRELGGLFLSPASSATFFGALQCVPAK